MFFKPKYKNPKDDPRAWNEKLHDWMGRVALLLIGAGALLACAVGGIVWLVVHVATK